MTLHGRPPKKQASPMESALSHHISRGLSVSERGQRPASPTTLASSAVASCRHTYCGPGHLMGSRDVSLALLA